jgi:hypothetical protein
MGNLSHERSLFRGSIDGAQSVTVHHSDGDDSVATVATDRAMCVRESPPTAYALESA